MSKLVIVYGDGMALESALGALDDAGLSDLATVIGDGPAADVADRTRARVIVPPVASGGSAVLATSPTVLAHAAVPPRGAEAVMGAATGVLDGAGALERVTGARSDEASYYADVIKGGGSLLVVEGEASDLDSAEAALANHGGQGMTRH